MDGFAVLGTMSIARTAFARFISMIFIPASGSTTERDGAASAFCRYMSVYIDWVINKVLIVLFRYRSTHIPLLTVFLPFWN
jgi:hypothetical protein